MIECEGVDTKSCRICLTNKKQLCPLFKYKISGNYAEMLTAIADVKVSSYLITNAFIYKATKSYEVLTSCKCSRQIFWSSLQISKIQHKWNTYMTSDSRLQQMMGYQIRFVPSVALFWRRLIYLKLWLKGMSFSPLHWCIASAT